MALGMPDLSKITGEFREQTAAILSLLTEVRDLLRDIRDQRDVEQNGPRG
jgi:hypothetical protein